MEKRTSSITSSIAKTAECVNDDNHGYAATITAQLRAKYIDRLKDERRGSFAHFLKQDAHFLSQKVKAFQSNGSAKNTNEDGENKAQSSSAEVTNDASVMLSEEFIKHQKATYIAHSFFSDRDIFHAPSLQDKNRLLLAIG